MGLKAMAKMNSKHFAEVINEVASAAASHIENDLKRQHDILINIIKAFIFTILAGIFYHSYEPTNPYPP